MLKNGWEHEFITTAKRALEEEEQEIKKINKRRGNDYTSFYQGLLNSRRCESVIVYAIIKRLLGNDYFKEWTINWEGEYPGEKKHCDIVMTPNGWPGDFKTWEEWKYIELGYYNNDNFKKYYNKIYKNIEENKVYYYYHKKYNLRHPYSVSGRFIILFHIHNGSSGILAGKIRKNRLFISKKIKWMYAGSKSSIININLPKTKKNVERTFEMAFLRVV